MSRRLLVFRFGAGRWTARAGHSACRLLQTVTLMGFAATARAEFVFDAEVPLNPKEHDLLELFLSHPGHLFPREEIIERVWHHRYLPASRTLDVHIRRLRAKVEQIGSGVSLQTVRGIGYRLVISDSLVDDGKNLRDSPAGDAQR